MFKLILQTKKLPEDQEAGYTILEAIIAILIVTVLMSVIAPVIGFSVGTRVSAKRIELASQAARSYLDWVKADTCKAGGPSAKNCVRSPAKFNSVALETFPAPATSELNTDCAVGKYCDGTNGLNGNLYCVDGDGDNVCSKTSLKDMIVQATSFNSTWGSVANYSRGYKLGIRVYRADAFNGTEELKKATTSTSVNNVGGDRRYPLVTLTTEISPTEDSFDNLKNRLSTP